MSASFRSLMRVGVAISALPLASAAVFGLRRLVSSAAKKPKKLQIVYHSVRARAEVARMILEFGGIPYVDESVIDYYGVAWKEAKPQAPFGQLPLLVVDGEEIAQSGAIVRYLLGFVPELVPTDPIARAKCDMIYEASCELIAGGAASNVQPIVNVFKGDDFAAKKAAYLEVAPAKIRNLERQYSLHGGPFFLGARPLYCDFGVYHVLNLTLFLDARAIDEHPHLQALMGAVEGLPRLKEFLAMRPKPVDIGTSPMLEPHVPGLRARR